MHVLITGRSGVGKSTICRELQRQGWPGVDSDRVPELCSWRNPQTNAIVTFDSSQVIDKSEVAWTWDETTLRNLLNEKETIFLCGGADNQLRFHDLFDAVFVLNVSPELQRQRILSRTEHDYGQLPALQDQILKEQDLLVKNASSSGAIILDATPKPEEIVAIILKRVHAR